MNGSKLELMDYLLERKFCLFSSYDSSDNGYGNEKFNFNYLNHRSAFLDDERCPINDSQISELMENKVVRVDEGLKVIVYFIGVEK